MGRREKSETGRLLSPHRRPAALLFRKNFREHWQLWLMMLPAIAFIFIFSYKPMYGVQIAFRRFNVRKGITGSDWVGLAQFTRLFKSYWFPVILTNTLTISALSLVLGFPAPILLALMANEIRSDKVKSIFQTVTYAPHFISTIVMCGMIILFLSPTAGIINRLLNLLGHESVFFMQQKGAFKWIYVVSGIWQGTGWSAIIYYAALAGVEKELLEAAEIDGASRLQKILYINLPVLVPTMVVLFVLQCGSILNVGYEKVYALQNSANVTESEVISTYVYKLGMQQNDFSFSTATNLFNSVVNSIILIAANQLSKALTKNSLW